MKAFSEIYEHIVLRHPHPPPPGQRIRPAAVSFLLSRDNDPKLLAIQKAPHPRYTWAGQVALPGGHVDPGDADSTRAALRELEEELRIPPEEVEIIGSLGHFMTLNNVCIEVLAGWWTGRGPLQHDPAEIARVLDIPVQTLLETHQRQGFHGREPDWTELRYPVDDTVIWGATARIVHHFMECFLSPALLPQDAAAVPEDSCAPSARG